MQENAPYRWIVEAVDTNNEVFFAVGNDRDMMTSNLRAKAVHYIGMHVRVDLIDRFPQMKERFERNGFIYA